MEIDFTNLISDKISDFHRLSTFRSGVEAMDKFIQSDFRMSVENHYCSAYGIWYKKELIAIYALSFDSLDLDSDDKEELELELKHWLQKNIVLSDSMNVVASVQMK